MSLPVDLHLRHSTPMRVSSSLNASLGGVSWSSAFETPGAIANARSPDPPTATQLTLRVAFAEPLPESEVPLMELFGSQSPVIQRTATFTQKSPVQSRLNFILLSDDENSSGGENDISLDQTLPSMQVPVVTEVVKSSDVDQQQNSVLGEILGSKPNKFIYPKKLHLSESATSSLRVDSDQKLSTSNEYSLSIQTPSPTAVASDYSLTDGKSAFNATAAGSVDQQQYESLSELRKLFAPVSASPSFNPPVTRPISSVGQFGGFSTGSKKPITVSSAAVARAQQMLAPIDEEMSFSATIDPPLSFSKNSGPIENEMNLNISSSHTTGFGGFSTGTGHKISVSKSAIEKAKKLLIEDVNNEITPLDDLFSIQPAGSGVPTMMGFSTGNGKSLTSVSAAALGRAQQLMASVSDELSKDMPLTTSHSVGSGKSSRFKPVVPTKSPPMPAEKRLSDVDGFTCTPLGGFATAGGRKVSPSASAVNRAKEMFRAVESPEDLSDSEQPVEQIVPKTKNIGTNRLVASDCAVVPTVSHLPEFKRLSTGDSDTPMQKRKAECQIEEDSKRLKSTETPGNVQTVPLVYFIVLRVYPVQFMEKCDDGQRVFRCERLEEIEAEKYNKRREQLGQQIAEKLEAELEKDPEYNEPFNDELDHSRLGMSSRFSQEGLSSTQQTAMLQLSDKISSKRMKIYSSRWETIVKSTPELQPRSSRVRSVVKFLIRCLDMEGAKNAGVAILTFWGDPSSCELSFDMEGQCFFGYELRLQSTRRFGATEQFSFGKESSFEPAPLPPPSIYTQLYRPRRLLSLTDVTKLIETMKSSDQAENEIDIIGVVVEVTNGGRVDTMQLSDLSAQFACVKFWNGLTAAGADYHLCQPGSVVIVGNVQIRKSQNSGTSIPLLSASEFTFVSGTTKIASYREKLDSLKQSISLVTEFVEKAKTNLRSVIGETKSSTPGVNLSFGRGQTPQPFVPSPSESSTPLRTTIASRLSRMGPKLLFNGQLPNASFSQNFGAPLKLARTKTPGLSKPFRIPVRELNDN